MSDKPEEVQESLWAFVINMVVCRSYLEIHPCDWMHVLEKCFMCFETIEGADVKVPQATLTWTEERGQVESFVTMIIYHRYCGLVWYGEKGIWTSSSEWATFCFV